MERNNFKRRTLPKNFQDYSRPFEEKKFDLVGRWIVESPTQNLYSFNGKIILGNNQFTLKINQLLLKDANLRNTEWIMGIVVYSGKDTKIMLNSQKSHTKQSYIEKKLNVIIFLVLCLQILICLVLMIIMIIRDSLDASNQDFYLGYNKSTENPIINFFTYFLLLNTMIPISLIVTLEVMKIMQCIFIVWDSEMFSIDDNAGCHVSSTTINEELGQVKYIFSDKTGTLTQNIMEFKALAIDGNIYGTIGNKLRKKASKIEEKLEIEYSFKSTKLENLLKNYDNTEGESTIITSKSGNTQIEHSGSREKAIESIKLLSICHECIPETVEIKGETLLFYQGPSPDESTLVDFTQKQGYEFWEVSEGAWSVKYSRESGVTENESEIVTYDIHKRMEFSSDRKRMGIFFTDPHDGKHKIYIKGADSEIKKRLDKAQINDKCMNFIDDFLVRSSVKGLRTLLYGVRILDDEEYLEFKEDIEEAEDDILNSDRLLQEVYDIWEQEIVLLGGTAVEDRLQDDVPQTLEDFRKAGIKVWMLTGDKMETAKNIGFSWKLITEEMIITEVKGDQQAKNKFTESFYEDNKTMMEDMKKTAIIIDADALNYLWANPNNLKWFITIAKTWDAVICSRVSPAQKAEVVRMIKKDDPMNITLSIGDGANDVSMILEADIGIGIFGKEGMMAVQASDFSIHKFKFLWQLVLYHGRYNYFRVAEFILYFFYKNIIFTIPQMYFAFISDFSAQSYFDDYYILFYNMFFTALPIVARGLFEKDIDFKIYLNHEQREKVKGLYANLYYVGQRSLIFTRLNYLNWTGSGFLQSLLIFIVHNFVFKNAILTEGGYNGGHWLISVSVFTSIIIIVNLRILITHRRLTIINLFSIFWLSIALFYIYSWVSDSFNFSKTYQTSVMLHKTPLFYLTLFLCVVVWFTVDLFIENIKINLFGRPTAFIRKEINNNGEIRENKEGYLAYIVGKKDKRFVLHDIKREGRLENRRIKRMEQLQAKIDMKNKHKILELSKSKLSVPSRIRPQ